MPGSPRSAWPSTPYAARQRRCAPSLHHFERDEIFLRRCRPRPRHGRWFGGDGEQCIWRQLPEVLATGLPIDLLPQQKINVRIFGYEPVVKVKTLKVNSVSTLSDDVERRRRRGRLLLLLLLAHKCG